jgi:hypothetical protein
MFAMVSGTSASPAFDRFSLGHRFFYQLDAARRHAPTVIQPALRVNAAMLTATNNVTQAPPAPT